MVQRFKTYLSIYAGFMSTSFSQAMSFRAHFFLLVVMDLVFYVTHLWSIDILYNHVSAIGTWDRNQLLFFASIMLAINQLTMTLVSENYWRFPLMIRTGEFDFTLIRPVNSVFISFFRVIRPGSFLNMGFTVPAVIYFGMQVGLDFWQWAALPWLILFGFLLQNSLEMFVSCVMFWMIDGTGINFMRVELQQLARWPDQMYPWALRGALTFIFPILLIGSGPVRWLYNPSDYLPMLEGFGFLLLFWVLLAFFWQMGLRAYESASS